MRFAKEYYNYTVNEIKKNDLIKASAKREILARLASLKSHFERGNITVSEYMKTISEGAIYHNDDIFKGEIK